MMDSDLISRSTLLYYVDKNIANMRKKAGKDILLNSAINLVQNTRDFIAQQIAVDAVEVVRCKYCKFAYINSFSAASGVAVCRKLSTEAGTAIRKHDDFCSYGEKREDDATD